MKKLLFFSTLALLFLGSCEKKSGSECIDRTLVNKEIVCTADYNPVCGCDGETYSNACVAKYHYGVVEYTPGPCGASLRCESITGPVFNFPGYADPIWISKAEIIGDCLVIDYRYSGGCDNHDLKLRIVPHFCATPPIPPTMLHLVHEAHGDPCEASISGSASYDLRVLQDSTQSQIEFYLGEIHNGYSKNFIYKY